MVGVEAAMRYQMSCGNIELALTPFAIGMITEI